MKVLAQILTLLAVVIFPTLLCAAGNSCSYQFEYAKLVSQSGKKAYMTVNFQRKPKIESSAAVLFSGGEKMLGRAVQSRKNAFVYEGKAHSIYWETKVRVGMAASTYEKYAQRSGDYAVIVSLPGNANLADIRLMEFKEGSDVEFPSVRVNIDKKTEVRIQGYCLTGKADKPIGCDYMGTRYIEIERGKAHVCRIERPL
jgi:hypothetical protein